LGGEITKTPQKATKSVPKQIDLVNQQQQTPQTSPKQTSISTPTPTQTQTQNSPQKAIPEPVVETVVPESVQVTESEQTVAITVSEPIQTPTQPPSTVITSGPKCRPGPFLAHLCNLNKPSNIRKLICIIRRSITHKGMSNISIPPKMSGT